MMRDYQGFQWEHWPAADTIDGKDRPTVSAIGGSDLGLDVHLLDRLTSCELPRLPPCHAGSQTGASWMRDPSLVGHLLIF